MFLLGCSLSGLANTGTGEDPFIQSITSPESHMYKKGRGSLVVGYLVKNLCEDFSVTSRCWVETSRRQFYPSLEFRDVDSNVATLILSDSGTSRRGFPTSRR